MKMDDIQSIAGAADTQQETMTAVEAIKALEESETRFHDIADRIEQGLWVRCSEGKTCLYLNPAFEKIWGRTLEEMNSATWTATVHPDDRQRSHKFYLEHQKTAKDYRQSYRIVRPDGEIRWIENQGYSVLDENGKLLRMAGISRDVTQQKKIDEELLLVQKLKSLSKLSAGLAHEINTPCQYVSNNLSFITESINDVQHVLEVLPSLFKQLKTNTIDSVDIAKIEALYQQADINYLIKELPEALEQSKVGMDHIKDIVLAMKDFSHPGAEKSASKLNETIANAITISTSEWKYHAEVISNFDESLPLVNINPARISQVILNLISNATFAIKEAFTDGELGLIKIYTLLRNNRVIIKVSDNGIGIPKNIVDNIFDPFFTTKEVGDGTGQGLSIVHKIIREDHGGTISVESTMNEGSCFTITLPLESEVQ